MGDHPLPDATNAPRPVEDEAVLSETLHHLEQIDSDDDTWTGGSVDESGEALTARRRAR